MSDNKLLNQVKNSSRNLSRDEGDKIVKVVKTIVDIIVKLSGGKPSFGNK